MAELKIRAELLGKIILILEKLVDVLKKVNSGEEPDIKVEITDPPPDQPPGNQNP